jgi:hypothetical protein
MNPQQVARAGEMFSAWSRQNDSGMRGRRPMPGLVTKRPAAMITASRRTCTLMVAPILLPKSDITMRLGSRRENKLAGWKSSTGDRIEPAVSSSEAKHRPGLPASQHAWVRLSAATYYVHPVAAQVGICLLAAIKSGP